MDGFKKSAKMSYVGHYICGGKVMKKAKGGIARGEEPMVEQEDIDYVSRRSGNSKKDMGLPVSVYTKGEYDSKASKEMMQNNRKEGRSQRLEDFIKREIEDSKRIGYDLKVAPSKKSYKALGEEAKEMKTGGMASSKKSGVNSSGNYTKPTMRKALFSKIKGAAVQGTAAGQWSARKAQMLAKQYKAKGGGYTD